MDIEARWWMRSTRWGRKAKPGRRNISSLSYIRNSNLHLEFKRMDLVQKLNAVAGGMNLKPGTAQI